MKSYFLLFIALVFHNALAQKTSISKQVQAFDQYVETVRKQWDIPGLSITVVKDGQVIFAKGYGVRELAKPDLVDTQTLFACASTTKAMTVALMGMLVDEGKLSWNDPVYKYLPELQFQDSYVTQQVTIRDLLIHDTGVGGTDFFTGAMNIPVNEMFRRMVLVKPSYSMRSGFIYQNTLYSAAGRIIERLMGKTWAEAIRERIFQPLGMTRTVPKRGYIKDDNLTRPHFRINDTIRVIDFGPDSEVGSAGAVWSSADDISKWLICMLDSSKYAGGRLLKPATWTEIFRPQTMVPDDEYATMQILKPNWFTYGLGWYQHDYRGHKVNFHTGSLAGLTAITAQLPEAKLGVFAFGNLDHAEGRHALLYKTLDWFALGGTRDWNTEFKTLYDNLNAQERKAEVAVNAKRVANTKPSLPLDAYAGRYTSPLYGEAEVLVTGDRLSFNINNVLKATLPHWHYDTFRGTYDKAWNGKATAHFTLNVSGRVETLMIGGLMFRR
ncbi:serine hydrolase [Spirosoma taeanense]|uniref:Serine hydrolase n=1 Tax=Spirosoma taeanense TaxID=2735870 RepID=A0A6M5YAB7_9BACT|nr:serine hydrolase [Spirosoma taeanense]QJW90316.1 serine hydrolase [Spirosoma taeanense]